MGVGGTGKGRMGKMGQWIDRRLLYNFWIMWRYEWFHSYGLLTLFIMHVPCSPVFQQGHWMILWAYSLFIHTLLRAKYVTYKLEYSSLENAIGAYIKEHLTTFHSAFLQNVNDHSPPPHIICYCRPTATAYSHTNVVFMKVWGVGGGGVVHDV